MTLSLVLGTLTSALLRRSRLKWTWGICGVPIGYVLWSIGGGTVALAVVGAGLLSCLLGHGWHRSELEWGADIAERARLRTGIRAATLRGLRRLGSRRRAWVTPLGLEVGRDERGEPARIPVGSGSGIHTLVLGATGAGKTVTETWIACRLVEAGHGAIAIDPKGDRLLRGELERAAAAHRRRFVEWTPEGPSAYNPYAHGSDGEIADKALAGEHFTEPHYLRQAQRYIGHAVRAMHAAEVALTPVSLAAHMDPGRLEVTSRRLEQAQSELVQGYLDSLGERERRDLGGVRDRLAIIAESEAAPWLAPAAGNPELDLLAAVRERAVVYMRLDADRRMLLSQMLGAAIVGDLVTIAAANQHDPTPTVVLLDEFAALSAHQVARLFARARSAGISLVLGTQELADLQAADEHLRERVLGNIEALIAHRQNVPESAELISKLAGSRPAWITTRQTEQGLLGSRPGLRGSKTRGHEFELHPSAIKRLGRGKAAVITPGAGRRPTIARIHHPESAHDEHK